MQILMRNFPTPRDEEKRECGGNLNFKGETKIFFRCSEWFPMATWTIENFLTAFARFQFSDSLSNRKDVCILTISQILYGYRSLIRL